MNTIQAQLREVEEELEARKKEREEIGKTYKQTRKANGLPPRRKVAGNNYGKVRRGGGVNNKVSERAMGERVSELVIILFH